MLIRYLRNNNIPPGEFSGNVMPLMKKNLFESKWNDAVSIRAKKILKKQVILFLPGSNMN